MLRFLVPLFSLCSTPNRPWPHFYTSLLLFLNHVATFSYWAPEVCCLRLYSLHWSVQSVRSNAASNKWERSVKDFGFLAYETVQFGTLVTPQRNLLPRNTALAATRVCSTWMAKCSGEETVEWNCMSRIRSCVCAELIQTPCRSVWILLLCWQCSMRGRERSVIIGGFSAQLPWVLVAIVPPSQNECRGA
jgi:hypothetical protein